MINRPVWSHHSNSWNAGISLRHFWAGGCRAQIENLNNKKEIRFPIMSLTISLLKRKINMLENKVKESAKESVKIMLSAKSESLKYYWIDKSPITL